MLTDLAGGNALGETGTEVVPMEMRGVGIGFKAEVEIVIPPGAVLYVTKRENGRTHFKVQAADIAEQWPVSTWGVWSIYRRNGMNMIELSCPDETIAHCTQLNT